MHRAYRPPSHVKGRQTLLAHSLVSFRAQYVSKDRGRPRRGPCLPTRAATSGTATSSDGFDGKSESQRARDRKMSRVEELASTEIGFKDSEGLKPFHLAIFVLVLSAGLWFLTVLLYFTADIKLQQACLKVLRRLLKTVALRQVMGILAAMTFVRFGLEPLVKMLRKIFVAPGTWEKSSEYYILKEVRSFCTYTPCRHSFLVKAKHSRCKA